MAILPRNVLFYGGGAALQKFGTLSRRTTTPARGGEEQKETFTRSSTGFFRDRGGVWRTAEANTPRVEWWDLNGDGVFELPTLLLEDARTSITRKSEQIENPEWGAEGSPAVTLDDAVAPDGTTTADKVDDQSGGETRAVNQVRTVANDSTSWCGSAFVKKASAGATVVCARIWLKLGTTTKDAMLFVDPITGATIANADVLHSGVIDLQDDYWRIWVSVANNSTGNTELRFSLYPAGRLTGDLATATLVNGATGFAHFSGGQVENAAFLSSYMKTVAADVSRTAEQCDWPLYVPPGALSLYLYLIERGTVITGSPRLVVLSDASETAAYIRIRTASGNYQADHNNATSTVSSTLAAAPTIGQRNELRLVLGSDGKIQLHQSIAGAAEVSAAQSAANTLAARWSGGTAARLYLNSAGSANLGFTAIHAAILARGAPSLADFRSLLP